MDNLKQFPNAEEFKTRYHEYAKKIGIQSYEIEKLWEFISMYAGETNNEFGVSILAVYINDKYLNSLNGVAKITSAMRNNKRIEQIQNVLLQCLE